MQVNTSAGTSLVDGGQIQTHYSRVELSPEDAESAWAAEEGTLLHNAGSYIQLLGL